MVIVPETSMTSHTGGSLTTTIRLPGQGTARLLVRFLLYIRGQIRSQPFIFSPSLADLDEEDGNTFLSTGNDLRLDLIESSEPPVRYTVSDLTRLQPDNNSWTMYQVGTREARNVLL